MFSRHGDLTYRIVQPSSVILLWFCTSYEDHNLLEYDAVNFCTCVGRLHENEVVGAYKASVSVCQITCIRSQRHWHSYSGDNCKCHWLRVMYTYGYTACVCVCVSVCIYIYTGCPRRNVPDFGRVFLMLKYTDITQNTYSKVERLRR